MSTDTDRISAADLWPNPPALPAPVIMGQRWKDAVFLHWRISVEQAAGYMPPGVVPDVFDGSAWVGIIGFQMQEASLGTGPGIPYFGTFTEINVRLYSREPDGTRGVVFVTLDATRLAVVLAARTAGIPYVWSHATYLPAKANSAAVGYSVRRFRGGARSDFAVIPDFDATAEDSLSVHLTARFGLHSVVAGRTAFIPNTHLAWPLFHATTTVLDDSLLHAAGFDVPGPPDSVLYSPGVYTLFGKPRFL